MPGHLFEGNPVDLQPLQQCLPQPLREAQADVRLPAVCPHHDEPGQDQPGAWQRGSYGPVKDRWPEGLPCCQADRTGWKDRAYQAGGHSKGRWAEASGNIWQEGTARAGGQRPLETSGRRAQQGQMGRGLRKHQAGGHSKGRWSEASGNSYLRETPGGPG